MTTDEAQPAFRKAGLLPELLADHLRERIANGSLAPGQRLVEQEFATELKVSRVPLREAFRILSAEGLVTLSPHRGAEVSTTSQEELEELFEVRALVEARAAMLAAQRAGPAQVQALSTILAEMSAAIREGNTVAYYRGAARFHDAVMAAGGNRTLARVYAQLKVRFSRYQMVLAGLGDSPTRSNQEHAQILRAIEQGDGERAAAVAENHVTALVTRYRKQAKRQASSRLKAA